MNQSDPALATTVTFTVASPSGDLLSDAEVKRLGDLNKEFYLTIRDASSVEEKEQARERVHQQVKQLCWQMRGIPWLTSLPTL